MDEKGVNRWESRAAAICLSGRHRASWKLQPGRPVGIWFGIEWVRGIIALILGYSSCIVPEEGDLGSSLCWEDESGWRGYEHCWSPTGLFGRLNFAMKWMKYCFQAIDGAILYVSRSWKNWLSSRGGGDVSRLDKCGFRRLVLVVIATLSNLPYTLWYRHAFAWEREPYFDSTWKTHV